MATIPIDEYVLDTLMRDLVGHDRRPSAFLVYLYLCRATRGEGGRQVQVSLLDIAHDVGLSKRSVQNALGWLGPLAALVTLAGGMGLSVFETARYVVGLTTVGYVSPVMALLFLAWVAAAGQIGTLALGRYGPYAGGTSPPPPGALRRLARQAR